MIKTNRYLLVFVGTSLILGFLLFVVLSKFIPLLIQHTVYYCQSFISTFSMRLPNNLGLILTGFLLLLAIFSFAKFLFAFIRICYLKKSLSSKVKIPLWFNTLTKKLKLQNKAFLVASDKPFAFCSGLINPKIYISTKLVGMTSKEELLAILVHERYHLVTKDTLTLILASAAESLFPFFPILSDLITNYKIEREVRADEEATNFIGSKEPILSVLKKLLIYEPELLPSVVPEIAEYQTLEERIKALGNKNRFNQRVSLAKIITSIFSTMVLFSLLVIPVQAVEIHGQEKGEDVMMICLQNSSCSLWCKENNSTLPYTPLNP